MNFNQVPLLRILLPFITGILLTIYSGVFLQPVFLYSVIVILLTLSFYFRKQISFKYQWLAGVNINLVFLFLGHALLQENTLLNKSDFFTKHNNVTESLVKVIEPLTEKEKSFKTIVEVLAVKTENKWIECKGKSLLYLKKDNNSRAIEYGDVLITNSTFNETSAPKNPAEFDYKRYLAFHNIHHQSYSSENNWKRVGENQGNFLVSYAINLRQDLLQILKEYGLEGQEYAVASALILGYEDQLDTELISAYSSSGALHVLSVSGLHVAIIFVIFNFFLGFLDKLSKGVYIKGLILILLLWGYALISGLSPSVMRAATMFSFIIIGKTIKRDSNIFNILAASGLLLLCLNPYLIMEVGFQLSYLAVIGIVLLQKPIYNLLEVNNYLLDKIWAITAVSIAAQIATFPLGLLYFHQFPNYFLFSNLVVIPVSTAVLYLGIGLFVVYKITLLAKWVAIALIWTVKFLNFSVFFTYSLPHAIVNGISINVLETWLLYFIIIVVTLYFFVNKVFLLKAGLATTILFLVLQFYEGFHQYQQKEIVIYNVRKSPTIDLITGKSNLLLTDNSLQDDDKKLLFHIKHYWWEKGLDVNATADISKDFENEIFFKKNNFVQFYDRKITIVNSEVLPLINERPIESDILLLSGNPKISIDQLVKSFRFKTIVADGSNPSYKVKKWLKESEALKLDFHSVELKGAFREIIN